ncbi:MFS transporter [Bifidobacterium parmae]|uniref:Putative proline/betaine transporter n=1 Tax=Bifidobacterium parmae TaxID=361854 RepID=A0A2N5J586_9BIFI|nr:MFS transporter [Bifidobacterium parmae]
MSAVEATTENAAEGKLQAMAHDSVKTVIAASMVGTAIEFYDFYAYGTAAANYFPHIFFSAKDNPTVALLMSLLTFAIAFIARPLGSLVFGHFGDRMGRKTTLVVSLMTMGIGTFLIGCLPTYDQAGVFAVAILCLLRFIQGIGLGGEWSGAALVATENAPEDKRALYGSFPELGAPIGFFLSNGTYFLLETFNDSDAMLAWGWRVPFLLSAVLVIIGLVVRVHMEETPIFRMAQEQKKVVKSPLTEVFRKSWKQVLQATFLVAVTYTLFYTLATWSLAWGTKEQGEGGGGLGFTNQEYLLMLMIAICVFAAFIVISCVNADKWGRKRVIITSSVLLVVFAALFPFLLNGEIVGQRNFFANMVFLCVGFALMGTAFGPIGAFLPELFDANVRYSGSGIGYNLAAIVGAAFVPTIATWLSSHFGVHSVGLYLGVMAVCCLVAVLSCRETKDVDFTK